MPHCILVLDASPVRTTGTETDRLIADKKKNPQGYAQKKESVTLTRLELAALE